MQPVDSRIIDYIHQMVWETDVTSTSQIKILVEVFLKELFKGKQLPSRFNKRFWPTSKDIHNHVTFALMQQRNSTVDQVLQSFLLKDKIGYSCASYFLNDIYFTIVSTSEVFIHIVIYFSTYDTMTQGRCNMSV